MLSHGPRENLFKSGAKALSDHDLLALLLRTGHPNADTKGLKVFELVDQLFERFATLKEILNATPEQLLSVRGVGPAKAATLCVISEISYRLLNPMSLMAYKIDGERSAYRYFHDITRESQEVLVAAFLTSQNKVICRREIFRGSLNVSIANPREIVREALRANAAKVIVAHNHPSQEPDPSCEDIEFTKRLQKAFSTVGIPLLDHLIVCDFNKYFSFARARLM